AGRAPGEARSPERDSQRGVAESPRHRAGDHGARPQRGETQLSLGLSMEPLEFESVLEAYPVRLEHFEGPLDLLLHLIKKHEVNIYDIPIAAITQQYLDY